MSIIKNNKNTSLIYYGDKAVAAVYKGAKLVWEAINSCFGKGFWINTKPWSDKDGWRNK